MKLFPKTTYKPPYYGRKKSSNLFVFFVILLAFSNLFCFSGLSSMINYNEVMTFVLIALLLFNQNKHSSILKSNVRIRLIILVSIITILCLVNYNSERNQIMNVVSTFGIIPITLLFSNIKWERKDLYKLGLAISVFGLFLNFLLLPGQILSGWNTNSSILAIPIILFGMSCIWCSGRKKRLLVLMLIFVISFLMITKLANRSALLALILFFFISLTRLCSNNIKHFRVLYALLIFINVLTPFFSNIISKSVFFQDLLGFTSSFTDIEKEGGFNGREELWRNAFVLISENPLFGSNGIRILYPHNFSLDLLIVFGWIGWITFYTILVLVLEKVYKKGSEYNVFIYAFLSILFLNTFENVFTCCNVISFFPYVFLSVALRINRDICKYEKIAVHNG